MIINSLYIEDGLEKRELVFEGGINLIHSQKNSVGKTTLMRLLLYSLGYAIPGTKKMRFDRVRTSCVLTLQNGEVVRLDRKCSECIELLRNENKCTYVLPDDILKLHGILFKSENKDIIDNLLGVIYTDQEKGWTLLNRGVVIGKNTFNIESLIRGISDVDCKELLDLESKLSRYVDRLDHMMNVYECQQQIVSASGNIAERSKPDEIDAHEARLLLLKNSYARQLSMIDRALHDNKLAADFVEEMKIMVSLPNGESLNVTRDNVCGLSETIEFLEAKRKHFSQNIKQVARDLDKLYLSKQKDDEQMELFAFESIVETFERSIMRVPVNAIAVQEKREQLIEERGRVRQEISYQTRSNSTVIFSMYNNIVKYMQELGIGNEGNTAANYLFTSNLKELSGAVLHKTVFAFKLAYILEIEKKLDIKLPLLLDSPRGREVDEENSNIMMNILKRDFSGNQIIMASIYQYDFENPNIIEINNRLMEVVEDVSCHNISE